jgi:hypothetical protein
MNLLLRIAVAICLQLSLFFRLTIGWLSHVTRATKSKTENTKHLIEGRMHRRGKIDVEFAVHLLDLVMAEADRLKVKPFLVSGTLLGFRRQGGPLPHDYDLDLGMMHDDKNYLKLLSAIQKIHCFSHIREVRLSKIEQILNPWLALHAQQPLIYKAYFKQPDQDKKLGIDFFIHVPIAGFVSHATVRTVWINKPFEIVRKSFGDRTYWVPYDVDLYLRENYGNFEVPQHYFENGTDCPNGMNVVGFRTAYWQAGRYAFFHASGDKTRAQIMARRIKEFRNPFRLNSRASHWRVGKFLDHT